MAEARHPILFAQRRVLWVAIAFGAVGALLGQAAWMRIAFGAMTALMLAVWLLSQRARPEVIVDDEGYRVEEFGKEKLRVRWSEVQKVRADEAEKAAYVDCGDSNRNLLLPPARGYGFRFERSDELYARILAGVAPEKIERVERLDPRLPGKKK